MIASNSQAIDQFMTDHGAYENSIESVVRNLEASLPAAIQKSAKIQLGMEDFEQVT